jgi:hypothetical protein
MDQKKRKKNSGHSYFEGTVIRENIYQIDKWY